MRNGHLSFEGAYIESIELQQRDFVYYLVLEDDNVVGITGHYPPEDGKKQIWLGWFGVRPQYRGAGWGEKILKATAQVVALQGVTEMFIYSGDRAEERNAHRLYEKNGFKMTGKGKVAGEASIFFRGPVPVKEIK